MKRLCNILILCFVTALLAPSPVAAQQSQEQMAAYYYDNGEYEQAAQLYESLLGKYPNKYYYQRLYTAYLKLERYKDAIRLVEKRRKTNPKELSLYVDEGNVLLRQENEKKALKCFDKAIDAITSDLSPVQDLAMAFINISRYDYAAKTYLTARAKTRSQQLYFTELVGVYQAMGDYSAMTHEYFDLLDKQPRMMSSVQLNMQKAMLEAPDSRLADGIRQALVDRVREHPDNHTYLEMMVWFSIQQKDFRFSLVQAEAVDARFPDKGGEQVFRVATIAFDNEDYDVATDAYRYLQRKGQESPYYFDSRVGELNVEFARINHHYAIPADSLALLKQKYESAIAELGKNERTIPLMRNYAQLMAYHANDPQPAVSMLDDILEIPRLKANIRNAVKLELGDILLFAGSVWDASLLYMQVEKENKNDILGAQAKFKNARLSYYNHDFEWANSQLKVLRSSTSKLIANDAMELSLLISDNMEDDSTYSMLSLFADADLLLYRNQLDSAWEAFDLVTRQMLSHPLFDEVLMRKAQIRMKQARYVEADSLLQRLVNFYPTDITADDALMLMAELNEDHLSNPAKALECYEKLLVDYPTSLYVDRARKRYNALKVKP